RDLVAQGCRFDENFDSYEDWDFWLQVARQTDFAHTAKVSAVYRAQLGNSGMSQPLAHNLQLQRLSRLKVWKKWWHKWTIEDFDCLVTDFHQQLVLLQQQLGSSVHSENELRRLLEEKERLQAEHEERIATLNQTASERNEQIMQLRSTIIEIFDSRSWKLTAPIRFFSRTTRKILQNGKPVSHLTLQYYRRESGYKLLRRTFSILRNEGLNGIKWRLRALQKNHGTIATGLKAKPAARLEKHNYLPL